MILQYTIDYVVYGIEHHVTLEYIVLCHTISH